MNSCVFLNPPTRSACGLLNSIRFDSKSEVKRTEAKRQARRSESEVKRSESESKARSKASRSPRDPLGLTWGGSASPGESRGIPPPSQPPSPPSNTEWNDQQKKKTTYCHPQKIKAIKTSRKPFLFLVYSSPSMR